MTETKIPVLIAGGGSVGLATALFLSGKGVPTLVVEQQDDPSPHPRATGLGQRTVEMLRAEGLQEAVNAVSVDLAGMRGKVSASTLAATEFAALPVPPAPHRAPGGRGGEVSPGVLRGTCPQNLLDSVVLPAARERGAVVRYSTRLESFTQDGSGVRAVLSDGDIVHADYLIAADGLRSAVRTALGIEVSGPGPLGKTNMSMLFRADLTEYLQGRRFVSCNIDNPAVTGLLVTVDGSKEWILHVNGDAGIEAFTRTRCVELIRAAVGDPAVEVEILSVLPWRPQAFLADRFRDGRVFLVGDAAHAVSPLGAFGLNTGIADGHNLAWKIAAVHQGWAGPDLLDTYAVERRAVAAMTLDQAVKRWPDPRLHWETGPEIAAARRAAGVLNAPLVHLGYRYDSAAVIDPRPELPDTEDVSLVLDGTPGSRLPHRWLADHDPRVSTLDLVNGFTLLSADDTWVRAGREAGAALSLELTAHRLPATETEWLRTVGIDASGAVLVRPDQIICWRSAALPGDPRRVVTEVLARVLARQQSRG
ncbi:2,4-dichlorophenol 6-monooxygenase [Nocardia sp. ET3-3]|uniref:2,4-dichlorophenol 6-monooxygenase n=1 Tax=Nocardia terrae TaxID=2675851 RepID=A0A7K1UWD1_9NOCA|nr:FAD-dependent monooxygenase [Nocardia terrae]MVU78617.1 2,4-dichlorophenol 6-monooxygenase [Nocardia terrae]